MAGSNEVNLNESKVIYCCFFLFLNLYSFYAYLLDFELGFNGFIYGVSSAFLNFFFAFNGYDFGFSSFLACMLNFG